MKKLLLFLLLLWGIQSTPLFANAAPPTWAGGSGVLLFDGESGVALRRAHILYTLGEERSDLAAVEVTYELENLEASDRELLLYFMHPGTPEDFSVVLDGREIPAGQPFSGKEEITNWTYEEKIFFRDPIDGRVFDDPVEVTREDANIVPFVIPLSGGGDHTLEIRFQARAAYFHRDEVINSILTQVYFLSPASFFEGETETILEVEVPSVFALESSVPLEAVSETRYRGRFDRLPADTWVLSYTKKTGLPFGTNRRGTNNLLAASLSLVLLGALLVFRKRRKWAWLLVLPLGLTALLYRPSYGTMFMILIFGPMIVTAVIFILLIRWMIIRSQKKKESR